MNYDWCVVVIIRWNQSRASISIQLSLYLSLYRMKYRRRWVLFGIFPRFLVSFMEYFYSLFLPIANKMRYHSQQANSNDPIWIKAFTLALIKRSWNCLVSLCKGNFFSTRWIQLRESLWFDSINVGSQSCCLSIAVYLINTVVKSET